MYLNCPFFDQKLSSLTASQCRCRLAFRFWVWMRGTGKATDLQEGLEGCHRCQSGQEGLCGRMTVQIYPLDQALLSKQQRRVSPGGAIMYVCNCTYYVLKLSIFWPKIVFFNCFAMTMQVSFSILSLNASSPASYIPNFSHQTLICILNVFKECYTYSTCLKKV